MKWDDFIALPAGALDETRKGGAVVITRRRTGDVRMVGRYVPGPEVALTVPSGQLQARRRDVGRVLDEGGAVAVTRWGVVEGILWTEDAERAWKEGR